VVDHKSPWNLRFCKSEEFPYMGIRYYTCVTPEQMKINMLQKKKKPLTDRVLFWILIKYLCAKDKLRGYS
jgi:hypothetical protein